MTFNYSGSNMFCTFNFYLTLAQLLFSSGREVIFLYLKARLWQVFTVIVSLCLCSLISKCMN
jgi:hypothetical protein